MYYQQPCYNYMTPPMYCGWNGNQKRGSQGYALILVLFILLVIIGAARW